MSVKFVSTILGPEMGAPILWTPGKMRSFCRKNHVRKIPLFWGGGGWFLGGGSADFTFMGARIFLKIGHGEVRVYRGTGVYPAECGEQLGTDPSKIGSSKSLVLKSFSGEGTLWDSSLPVSLTLWDTPALFTPPLPLPQRKTLFS